VILLASVLIGFIATFIRARLKHRTLKSVRFRLDWLVFLAVLPQAAIFEIPSIGRNIPEEYVALVLLVSMALLLVFVVANLRQAGMWALGTGLLCNFLVILANRGWMPISPATLHQMFPARSIDSWIIGQRLGLSKDRILLDSESWLWPLSDRFVMPIWVPFRIAFSAGDILIAAGIILLLWSLSDQQPEESK
jgi:hypothetical protein